MSDAATSHGDQQPLIAGLQRPATYGHFADEVRVIETHISWVLLAGGFAYKIKKPVDLGFVDFTALSRGGIAIDSARWPIGSVSRPSS